MDAQAAKAASQIISIHANGCKPKACERMRKPRSDVCTSREAMYEQAAAKSAKNQCEFF